MTFSRFCIACGATPKWVQNTARILGWSLAYGVEAARHVGLVKQLQEDLGVPLDVADRLAAEVLEDVESGHATAGAGSTARVTVDVDRYLSDFSVRLAHAMSHHEPRRRGRKVRRDLSAVERAQRYGLDIGLIASSLRSTPGERIRRLNENMEFVRALRAGR